MSIFTLAFFWLIHKSVFIFSFELVLTSHSLLINCYCSVAKIVFDSLWPHGLKHARLPCPSLSPVVFSNSCPSSQWCHPTILSSVAPLLLLPSVFPSIRVFSNESALPIKWPKYWSFSFSISPSNECSGLICFWIDWFDLAVQGTLKSLLQHHSSKATILWRSAFFMVQLSYLVVWPLGYFIIHHPKVDPKFWPHALPPFRHAPSIVLQGALDPLWQVPLVCRTGCRQPGISCFCSLQSPPPFLPGCLLPSLRAQLGIPFLRSLHIPGGGGMPP